MVLQVIGSRGAIIQEMQARSGCKIHVNQDFPPGVNREVTFTGNRDQISAARKLVAVVLEQGPTAIHMLDGPVVNRELDCPQPLVGRIIGAGGATIREIQSKCGAKVQIDQNFPEGAPRKVHITGNPDAVQQAVMMITFVMENGPPGPGGLPFNSPSPLPSATGVLPIAAGSTPSAQTLECAKMYVGRIIGRGGETINIIQGRTGARVQIEQNVPEGTPCKVNITGLPQCVAMAAQLVQDIIINGPNRLSAPPAMGGGPPMGGGYYGGGGYTPPMQQQQFSPYGGGAPQMGMYQQHHGGYTPQHQQGYGHPQQTPAHHQQQHAAAGSYGGGGDWNGRGQANSQTQAQTQPRPSALPPLPAGWSEHKTEEGNLYWYNAATGVSQV